MTKSTIVNTSSSDVNENVKVSKSEILDRIDGTARDITMYREKIVANVQSIVRLFSYHHDCCGVCEYTEGSHGNGSDHSFKPTINIDVEYQSGNAFASYQNGTRYYLAIDSGNLVVYKDDPGIEDEYVTCQLIDLSTSNLHKLIDTNAIPKFFEELAEALDKTKDEYKKVLDLSEKLVKATQPSD